MDVGQVARMVAGGVVETVLVAERAVMAARRLELRRLARAVLTDWKP